MPNTAATLASALREHKPSNAAAGYPLWLRIKAGNFVRQRRKAGAKLSQLSRELGVSTTSLNQWARISKKSGGGGFAPVIEAVPAATLPLPLATATTTAELARPRQSLPPQPSAIHLTSPQGFSLHGLSVEQAVAIFVGLR